MDVQLFVCLATIVALLAAFIVRDRAHSRRQSELLDRLMARDYDDYSRRQMIRTQKGKSVPRNFSPMSDEDMAKYEQQREGLRLMKNPEHLSTIAAKDI